MTNFKELAVEIAASVLIGSVYSMICLAIFNAHDLLAKFNIPLWGALLFTLTLLSYVLIRLIMKHVKIILQEIIDTKIKPLFLKNQENE